MFCDLVGSTSLASKLDAEDWRNLVGSYLDEASGAVTGLGGHVLKKLGDGLMALFGYPQAQENDAERAVRAALAIQRALGELNARNAGTSAPQLIARIGLESGQVVVDATGEVFGEAPNVAARVQSLAEPGSVVITAGVQRQVAGLFVAEDKGAHSPGHHGPQGLSRKLRRDRAAPIPVGGQGGPAQRRRSGLFAPDLRHRAWRIGHRRPSRYPRCRRHQRARSEPAAARRQGYPVRFRLLRLFDILGRRRRIARAVVH